MKKVLVISIFLVMSFSTIGSAGQFQKTYVYKDAGDKANKFIPSGWMGDFDDLRMFYRCFVQPKSGKNCLKIMYSAESKQKVGWAGIYWQNAVNNWGEEAGENLKGAKRLVFYIRGDKGGEIIDGFRVGGITGDTANIPFHPVILTKRWKKYTIDLRGEDLSNIVGGFAFVVRSEDFEKGCIFYLDEIYFE